MTAVLNDGRRVHVFVEHAIGSLQNPMTDAQLEAKFHGLADAVLGAEATHRADRRPAGPWATPGCARADRGSAAMSAP